MGTVRRDWRLLGSMNSSFPPTRARASATVMVLCSRSMSAQRSPSTSPRLRSGLRATRSFAPCLCPRDRRHEPMPSDRQRSYIRFRLSRRALLALAPVVLRCPHIAGLTNPFDILVASAFFLLASLLLLPRLLWPLLNRPLYAIATHIDVREETVPSSRCNFAVLRLRKGA